ncbi:uncharacterized protein LOC116006252 isoform X1 [Ipomoea triloba]|uniref:uncharacterized protein LOC116006252 isoform X1 n=1 Tax=Ipomoea triloba TaxID=35885 RepID=UPI00125D0BDF|nr:uncharacterized protein LOC116006252 isoform X1 [Ipomoea triloba]
MASLMVSKKEVEESSEYEVTEGTTEITHSQKRFPESKTHSHASSEVTDSELDEDEVQSTRGSTWTSLCWLPNFWGEYGFWTALLALLICLFFFFPGLIYPQGTTKEGFRNILDEFWKQRNLRLERTIGAIKETKSKIGRHITVMHMVVRLPETELRDSGFATCSWP